MAVDFFFYLYLAPFASAFLPCARAECNASVAAFITIELG
jgi:hypothetical protein